MTTPIAPALGSETNPPEPAPAAAVPPVEPPAAPVPDPAITFPSTEAFNARVEQAARALLKKEIGIGDPKAIRQQIAEAEALKAAEEERRTAEMSELERERTARIAAEADSARYQEEAAESALEAHLARVCADRGIKDIEYASYRVRAAAEALEDGAEPLDSGEFLDSLLADARYRIALGVDDVAPPPDPTRQPATTTPANIARPGSVDGPPKPAVTTPAAVTTDANAMSPEAWEARKRALGIG